MRFAPFIAVLLLGISPAWAASPPAKPACPGCQRMDFRHNAHQRVLDDLQREYDSRRARAGVLQDKVAQGTLTAAERIEGKRLADELMVIGPLRDQLQAIVDQTKRDSDNCKKACPIDRPPPCPGCQGMEAANRAHQKILGDLQREYDSRLPRANVLIEKGAQGPLTEAEESEGKLFAAISRLRNDWQRIADDTKRDMDQCKRTCPIDAPSPGTGSVPGGGGVPVPGGGVPVPGGGTPVPGGGTPVPGGSPPAPGSPPRAPAAPAPPQPPAPPAAPVPAAVCPECAAVRERLERVRRDIEVESARQPRLARRESETERAVDELELRILEALISIGESKPLQALRSAPSAADRSKALKEIFESWPGYSEVKREADNASDSHYHHRDILRNLRREAAGIEVQLGECLGRCGGGDGTQLRVVVGGSGNNPFNPTDPVGGGGTVIQRPQPGQPGTLQFSSAGFSGSEGGAVLIIVARSGGDTGAVSVQYATAAGTASAGGASAGSDFTPASGTLSWRDREITPKSFSIALPDDTQVESTETFTVNLTAPTGGATLGSPATATVSIADNDSAAPPQPAGNLQFSAATYSVTEGPGASVTIMVTRTGGSAGVVGVTYLTGSGVTGPGSAAAGSDYTATNGNLTWANGDTAPKSFTVPILDDALVEGSETFFVTLNSPSGGATLGAPGTATVTITDNDVATGPCGATGSAWTPNAGSHLCSGGCSPTPTPQQLSVSGDIVTINPFHAGGPATFQGCGSSLTSQSNTLTYFGQSNHTATITRSGDIGFSANIVSSGGGSCSFSCSRTGP